MTVDALLRRMELLLSDICFSGLKNAQPILLHQLDELRGELDALGMVHGAQRCAAFNNALTGYRRGERPVSEAADALCALECYCKNALHAPDASAIRQPAGRLQ